MKLIPAVIYVILAYHSHSAKAKEISCIDLIPTPNIGDGVVEIEVVEEIVGGFFMYVDLISTLKTVEKFSLH